MELPQQITYLDGCGQEDDGTPDSCMEDDKDGDEGSRQRLQITAACFTDKAGQHLKSEQGKARSPGT